MRLKSSGVSFHAAFMFVVSACVHPLDVKPDSIKRLHIAHCSVDITEIVLEMCRLFIFDSGRCDIRKTDWTFGAAIPFVLGR
ncbi:hypothetical protein EDD36DRAFT_449191 [Exophiala viscosa]|uniref:Secreted protein n=1 Tax=Exophiala viscosa TaxID=2486360 RepID=A0AAN6DL29_9EURO|nr:hypothetical protein EDD36DRAFT_449191 [Exophiala viscosa]